MNDTVITLCAFPLCIGLSCGQTVWVCCAVDRLYNTSAGRLYAASIFLRLILYITWKYTHEQNDSSYCLQHTTSHIQHQNLQNIPSLSLLWIPHQLLLPDQKPIKTYSKLSITTSKIFSSTEASIHLGCVNKNACGGELGSISLHSSSPKRKARHSVLKKFDLDRVAELTPRKKKLHNMIRTRA